MKSMPAFLCAVSLAIAVAGCGRSSAPASNKSDTTAVADTETASGEPGTKPESYGEGQPLELTRYYSTPASMFPKITSFPWKDVAVGAQTFDNVRLDIGGMLSPATGRPMSVDVNRSFPSAYIYHCAFNTTPEGTTIGTIVFNYSDGTSATNQIRYGSDVRDWYEKPGEASFDATDPRSKVVWSGPNHAVANTHLRFFLTELRNPKPDVSVTSFDLMGTSTASTHCIMAITTGPVGLVKKK